jgi:SAM-dependent methyltransferase
MEADPNAAQREFWNGPQGQNWVANQVALDATLTGVSALLLDEIAAPAGARILDVGCGAGDTTIALARAVGPRGTVTGVDISEPLLALARARAEAAAVENAVFLHADAAAGLALRVGPATRHIRDKGGDETDARAIADGIRARFAPYLGTAGVRVPAVVNVFRAGRG